MRRTNTSAASSSGGNSGSARNIAPIGRVVASKVSSVFGRPRRNCSLSAGDAPNKYISSQLVRRKFRISAKYRSDRTRGGVEGVERVRAAAQELLVERGRCAEQIHQQPARPAEIPDQREISLRLEIDGWHRAAVIERGPRAPYVFVQRIVVVNSGYALHGTAVSQRQTAPGDMLQHADIRRAIPADRDVLISGKHAGHGVVPEQFTAEMGVGEAMQIVQLF